VPVVIGITISGEAISLVTDEEEHHFYIIQKKMGRKVEKIDADTLEFGF
jgi:ATP-dependent RNA helicase RhlE